jgi:hypothetical protein
VAAAAAKTVQVLTRLLASLRGDGSKAVISPSDQKITPARRRRRSRCGQEWITVQPRPPIPVRRSGSDREWLTHWGRHASPRSQSDRRYWSGPCHQHPGPRSRRAWSALTARRMPRRTSPVVRLPRNSGREARSRFSRKSSHAYTDGSWVPGARRNPSATSAIKPVAAPAPGPAGGGLNVPSRRCCTRLHTMCRPAGLPVSGTRRDRFALFSSSVLEDP